MYPCSNPELVAAVSEAGGLGVVQPISLTYVHGHDFREGLRLIRRLTSKPIGMNALIEQSSKTYRERMERWIDVALEEGVRFFVTSLGNPRWVVDRVRPVGGVVYHDVTERKWAEKGLDGGVHGLIAVNDRAGGHAGGRSAEALLEELLPLGLPVVCAGGIGDERDFARALSHGLRGRAARDALHRHPRVPGERGLQARRSSRPTSGTSCSRSGSPACRWRSSTRRACGGWEGRRARSRASCCAADGPSTGCGRSTPCARSGPSSAASCATAPERDYWQAGKSVAGIDRIEPAGEIVRRFAGAWRASLAA